MGIKGHRILRPAITSNSTVGLPSQRTFGRMNVIPMRDPVGVFDVKLK
jgi:hypothetical protein